MVHENISNSEKKQVSWLRLFTGFAMGGIVFYATISVVQSAVLFLVIMGAQMRGGALLLDAIEVLSWILAIYLAIKVWTRIVNG